MPDDHSSSFLVYQEKLKSQGERNWKVLAKLPSEYHASLCQHHLLQSKKSSSQYQSIWMPNDFSEAITIVDSYFININSWWTFIIFLDAPYRWVILLRNHFFLHVSCNELRRSKYFLVFLAFESINCLGIHLWSIFLDSEVFKLYILRWKYHSILLFSYHCRNHALIFQWLLRFVLPTMVSRPCFYLLRDNYLHFFWAMLENLWKKIFIILFNVLFHVFGYKLPRPPQVLFR